MSMAERCLAGHDACASTPIFHFEWTENRSGLPVMGKHWESWSCEEHPAAILHFAMSMRHRVGPVRVEAVGSDRPQN